MIAASKRLDDLTHKRLLKEGYTPESLRAYDLTGSESARLACLSYREEAFYNTRRVAGREGRVVTPRGPGTLVDAKRGEARVLLDREKKRAERAKPTGSKEVPGMGRAMKTDTFPVSEVRPEVK